MYFQKQIGSYLIPVVRFHHQRLKLT